jgi:hypothetical protein
MDLSSSERVPHNKKAENVLTEFPWKRKKNCSWVPNSGLIPGQTG